MTSQRRASSRCLFFQMPLRRWIRGVSCFVRFADAKARIMTTPPTISVLMPVYNAQRYLREAVQSILDQTSRDFEFIIVNDGSTDHSLRMLRGFEKKDARIKLISRENTGLV